MALVDRHIVYVGSLNLDSRSARINTEIGVRMDSAEIAAMLFNFFRIEEGAGVVRVTLKQDGSGVAWSALDAHGREQPLDHEPDANWWLRSSADARGAGARRRAVTQRFFHDIRRSTCRFR